MSTRTGRRARHAPDTTTPARSEAYRQLRHPFAPQQVFSDDGVANIHNMALRALSELGMKILLPEARQIFANAGALVDDDTQMVRIGADLVDEALRSAPRSIRMRAANPAREQAFEPGAMMFSPGSGCPNTIDALRGRRPGSLKSYQETLKLVQSFDIIHILGPSAEPQDIAPHLRHYDLMRSQMCLSDKPMYIYARGRAQVQESLEMIALAHGLDDAELRNGAWAYSVINTNSPRQIDVPMAMGIIDMARAGQLSIMTPFCLAGAMAPITISGALVLQHAEALAAITLAQLTAPGAPVAYGGFASNVDMKSGSPAFGTPAHMKLTIGSGQLARHIGLPWRSAAGAASNTADMQAAGENHMGLWAAMQANATLTIHSAGWLEGGLSFGYEKFINDVEGLQQLAEMCAPVPEDTASLGWGALQDVDPGGHFFATQHTMDRYRDAFYDPIVADLSNHGAWVEAGSKTSTQRATDIWQQTLHDYVAPPSADGITDRLNPYIEACTKAGGAHPNDG
ncbi:MAG: trimethylamine methyltransferase family protein [Sulfitobacter sp.]